MTNREMEAKLQAYGTEVHSKLRREDRDPERMRRVLTILTMADCRRSPRRRFWDFICVQGGFIGRWCIGWEMLWLWAFVFLVRQCSWEDAVNTRQMLLISTLPTVLACLLTESVVRYRTGSMLELEQTTKYSLKQTVLMHLLLQNILEAIVVAIGMVMVSGPMKMRAAVLLVYGLTPMILLTAALLALARHLRGRAFVMIGRTAAVLLCFGSVFLGTMQPGWMAKWQLYQADRYACWVGALLLGFVLFAYELIRLGRELEYYEAGIEWNFENI